ncbi:MAG: hypothetical protein J7K00_04270 [Candidatus Diapherotrites archaeon]|nr:hypothetical protein [Candidatus Diapherotrites archaeon]
MTISRLKLNRFKDKKALSSTIASVLLVGISVSTFILLWVWSQDEVNRITGSVKTRLDTQIEKSGINITLGLQGNKAIVFNEGLQDITKIAVYVNNNLVPCYSVEGNTELASLTWEDHFNDQTKEEILTNTTIGGGKATLNLTYPPDFQSENPLSDAYNINAQINSVYTDNEKIYAVEYSAANGSIINIYDRSNPSAGAVYILNAAAEPTDQLKSIHGDENYIYVVGEDDEVLVYDKIDLNLTTTFTATEPTENTVDAVFSDINFVYAGDNAYTIITLTDKEWNRVRKIDLGEVGINSIYADTKYLYAGLQDGSIAVVSKSNWEQTTSIITGTAQVTSVKSDVSRIYAATEDNKVHVFEKDTWDLLATLDNS